MKTTSKPSSTTALKAVAIAIASQPMVPAKPFPPRTSVSLAKAWVSSRSGMTPAARSIALRSQRIPKSTSRTPTASWSSVIGMRPSAGPSRLTSTASNSTPMLVPSIADRQPRTVPTAITIVIASMNSTSDPRNAAVTGGPIRVHSIIIIQRLLFPPRLKPFLPSTNTSIGRG